jgi:hypothetical protein|tara:strand:- start:849 stop:1142 length:294 start_codon:yes stop_codon:yes gene_type:complete
MSNKYIYWKWGKGELMKKSYRKKEDKCQKEDKPNIISDRIDIRDKNTREINSERMGERELLIQTSINPFMYSNNYLDDLKVQDEHLRPLDSNIKSDT